MAILAFFRDGGAVKALTDAILGALPTELAAKTLEESLDGIRRVQKTSLFHWSDADAQAQVR
eukprot:6285937-Amphidinium_carterae.2